MDIWSRIFAEIFRIIFKVFVRMDRGGEGQPNADRCGMSGGGQKSFMDGPKSFRVKILYN